MVDILRGNIIKFLEAVPQPILERDDIDNLLDGYVDRVIDKHKDKDKISFREDMKHNGKIDDEDTLYKITTKEQAQQYINSFINNFDETALKNIESLRDKKSKKAKAIVKEFEDKKRFVLMLQEKFDLYHK